MFHLKYLDLGLGLGLGLFTIHLQQLILLNHVTLGITKDCPKNPTTPDCQHGLTHFPEIGMCIGVFDDNATDYDQARTACSYKGSAELLAVETALIEKIIQEIVPASKKKHWIGLTVVPRTNLLSRKSSDQGAKNQYSNWKVNSVPINVIIDRCVVRNAADGLWEREDCSETLGYICSKRPKSVIKVELELEKGYAPLNTVYFGQVAHIKCRASTLQRGKVVLRYNYTEHEILNVTSEFVKGFSGELDEETSQSNKDCTNKIAIYFSFFVIETMEVLPTFQCCLMLYNHPANCATPLKLQITYPNPIRPTLIVGYHNPPPTIYHGLKLRATCANNGRVIVWALKTPSETLIWRQNQILHKVTPQSVDEKVKDVEIKVLERKMDSILGIVMNSSFSVKVKPILNNSVLSCYSHDIGSAVQANDEQDPLRAASKAFRYEIYYAPHRLHLKIDIHQGRNVVFRNSKFTAGCEALVGSNGLMIFSMSQDTIRSRWKIKSNGKESFEYHQILYYFKKKVDFVKTIDGPFIRTYITVNVMEEMEGTVFSCYTRGIKDPLNTNEFWNQEKKSPRLLVYDAPCWDHRVNGTMLFQRGISYEDYSLVYYSCNGTRLIPSPKWPVMCTRDPDNGSLTWNATPPICVERPLLVSWQFWFKWMITILFILVVILLLIFPYNCESKGEESGMAEVETSPEFQYEDQNEIYTVHTTEPIVTVVSAQP